MSAPQRLILVLVGIVVLGVVAIVAILALGTRDPETGRAPSGSPVPTANPSEAAIKSPSPSAPATSSAAPSATVDLETGAVLAEIEEQMIAIRGLEAADIGPAQIINREQLAVELRRLLDEQYPPEEREQDNIVLRALGLLEPGQDVAQLQLQLLGDSVLGFYDPTDKRLVIVSDAGLTTGARVTYAHEYTHALQDASFDLDSLETDADGEDDRSLARTSLIEGDASIAMLAWMFQNLTQEEILEYLGSVELPDTSGIPSWMVAQLGFPYDTGLSWATGLAGGDPTNPDFSQLDAAFSDPPDSTEQIVDIAKWSPREAPVAVDTLDLAAGLGSGWEEVGATPIGQATIAIMLEYFGVAAADARVAADGWGGDRAVIAAGPDEAFAVAWRLSWDTAADAAEFASAYETVVASLDFPATVSELPSGDILVAHASSDDLLTRTVDAAN